MGHKKLIRFAEIETFPNVLIYPKDMQGPKGANILPITHPLTLELACGKGDYTLGLARMFPGENFMGVDLKGNRIWKGAKTASGREPGQRGLSPHPDRSPHGLFRAGGNKRRSGSPFPDPFLRKSKAKKRLTHPRFLALYQQIPAPGGTINLKTDSANYTTLPAW